MKAGSPGAKVKGASKKKKPAKSTPVAQAPGLTKTKGTTRPKAPNPQQQIAAMRQRSEAALDEVYGQGVDRDDANNVVGALRFDRVRLHELAESLDSSASDLKTTTRIDTQSASFDRTRGRLTDRLRESRQIADQVTHLQQAAAAVGTGVTLATDPMTADAWAQLRTEMAKQDRSTQAIDGWVAELTTRLGHARDILTTINTHSGVAAAGRIPNDLLTAMGIVPGAVEITRRLQELRRGIARQHNATLLRNLLRAADAPVLVPALMADADAVGATLLDVLNECGGNAVLARKLLRTVIDSRQNIDYFFNGEGGRQLSQLRFAASIGAPVWAGETITNAEVTYGDPGNPVTFAQIVAIVEAAPPPGGDLPPLPLAEAGRDRYVGGRVFGNVGAEGGMLLPFRDNTTNMRISYTEYDIRPYVKGERGQIRVVVGDDGNSYHTDDHYQTFKRIT